MCCALRRQCVRISSTVAIPKNYFFVAMDFYGVPPLEGMKTMAVYSWPEGYFNRVPPVCVSMIKGETMGRFKARVANKTQKKISQIIYKGIGPASAVMLSIEDDGKIPNEWFNDCEGRFYYVIEEVPREDKEPDGLP